MAGKKGKMLVPLYEMSMQEFYFLLRLVMEITGKKSINGVQKGFFEPATYEKKDRLLKSLVKKNIVELKEDNILLHGGVRRALETMLDSSHCMNFQNAFLTKKGQILSVYYAGGQYAAALQDKGRVTLVYTPEAEAVYAAFEKVFEAKGVSEGFQAERWRTLAGGGLEEPVGTPVREAMIVHSSNRLTRERATTAMVADKLRLQILRAGDGDKYKAVTSEALPASRWYGVILRELERLREEHHRKTGEKPEKDAAPPKSEYLRVVESPSFPKSGPGFFFWCLKRILTGLPRLAVQTVKRKCLAPLFYLLWAAALFFYNMWVTCYFNDTFMLDRSARLGNLTPYLMSGLLHTPSKIKGFSIDLGQIDTVFLVFPLMLLLTMAGRHVILQIKQKKHLFLADLIAIPSRHKECRGYGYGGRRLFWGIFALACGAGFLLMNPITLFLAAIYALLIFAQGKENGMAQFCMLWACASGRRKIDAGLKKEPRTEKFLLPFFYAGGAFLAYGAVSLALWFAVDYNFWVRLVITLLMIAFALLQVFRPDLFSAGGTARTIRTAAVLLTAAAAAAWIGGRYGIVLADDGGWSESGGTLAGLMQNMGFSTILGLSLFTIGLALGGPLAWVLAGSCIVGGGTFLVGLTNTAAGDYVRKSAKQYFFGPDDGEDKTLLCGGTELANFVAGFLNPAEGTGALAAKIFYGGKIAGDLISTAGDAASTAEDFKDYINGTGDVSAGDLIWDVLGLGLDIYGIKGDIGDTADLADDIARQGDGYQFHKGNNPIQELKDLNDAENAELGRARAEITAEKQTQLDLENARHRDKIDSIQQSIADTQNGAVTPPGNLDKDAYIRQLNSSAVNEEAIYNANLADIDQRYADELARREEQIADSYRSGKLELEKDIAATGADHTYSAADEGSTIIEDVQNYHENHPQEDTAGQEPQPAAEGGQAEPPKEEPAAEGEQAEPPKEEPAAEGEQAEPPKEEPAAEGEQAEPHKGRSAAGGDKK